jgi:hypothetical protein
MAPSYHKPHEHLTARATSSGISISFLTNRPIAAVSEVYVQAFVNDKLYADSLSGERETLLRRLLQLRRYSTVYKEIIDQDWSLSCPGVSPCGCLLRCCKSFFKPSAGLAQEMSMKGRPVRYKRETELSLRIYFLHAGSAATS